MSAADWAKFEIMLCVVFVLSRVHLFTSSVGEPRGDDLMNHLQMLTLDFADYYQGTATYFYAYHPPLGFQMAKAFYVLFMDSAIASVQLLSCIFSLAAFVALRALLKNHGKLREPTSIAFLYLWGSIPIVAAMSVLVSLDGLILSFSCMTLYACSLVFFGEDRPGSIRKLSYVLLLSVVLSAAMYTKFSGWILAPIPFVAALCGTKKTMRYRLVTSVACVGLSMLMVLPFYYDRYYRTWKTLFPTNTQFFHQAAFNPLRDKASQDPVGFASKIFSASYKDFLSTKRSIEDNIRMVTAWNDFWYFERYSFYTPLQISLSRWLIFLSPMFVLLGFLVRVLRREYASRFARIELVFVTMAAITILAMVHHVFQNPLPDWAPMKGVYMAVLTLPAAYYISFFLSSFQLFSVKKVFVRRLADKAFMTAMILVVLVGNSVIS